MGPIFAFAHRQLCSGRKKLKIYPWRLPNSPAHEFLSHRLLSISGRDGPIGKTTRRPVEQRYRRNFKYIQNAGLDTDDRVRIELTPLQESNLSIRCGCGGAWQNNDLTQASPRSVSDGLQP